MDEVELRMPFTNEKPQELQNVLEFIIDCPLPLEVFDAFLGDYSKNKDLDQALFFARCEWDV